MRKVFFSLMVLVLATFALPGFGAPTKNKMYNITTTSSAPTQIEAHLTNVSVGAGNSTITAFTLTFTGVAIASVDLDPAFKTTNKATPPSITNTTIGGVQTATVSVTNTYPIKVGGPSYTLTIHLSDCGDGIALTGATVTPIAGSNETFDASGFTFPVFTDVTCGNIACGAANVSAPNSANPGNVVVTRGFYDKDGISNIAVGQCETVPYTVTTFGTGKHHFEWPLATDDAAAFEYKITTNLAPLTQVAWLNTLGGPADTGTPVFIPGLACLVPPSFALAILPMPYGTLVADNGGTIDVDPSTPAAFPGNPNGTIGHGPAPFDVQVEKERMTVTFVDTVTIAPNERWTVTRPVGGTSTTAHVPPLLVMYTPLPIMTVTQGVVNEYMLGNQAQVCIKEQVPGVSTTFIDVGDAWHAP